MKNLIWHNILGSIEDNLCLGNITDLDAQKLKGYVQRLYEHIYSHYEEMEEINNMTNESFMTEIDIIAEKYEQLDKLLTEKESILKKQDIALKAKTNENQALRERIRHLEQKLSQMQD